eukprot:gene6277-7821_t
MNPIVKAASMGESLKLIDLIKANPSINVNEFDSNGNTAIQLAAALGHFDCVKVLVENGKARFDQPDHKGRTTLFKAASSGFPDIVEYLLQQGSQVNKQDTDAQSPLYACCESAANRSQSSDDNFIQVARLLIVKGKANVHLCNSSGKTALVQAVKSQNLELISLLISNGAKPDQKDHLSISSFDYANGDSKILSVLKGETTVIPTTTNNTTIKSTSSVNNNNNPSTSSTPSNCPKCSNSLSKIAKFCSKCGTKIQ